MASRLLMENIHIGPTPTLLIGEKCEHVFLFVHGLHGRKEEAQPFAEVAVPKGYQVLSIDLPLESKPWDVQPLLNEVSDYLYRNWKTVSIRANSIGAWLSLLAFQSKNVDQALLVSPILDIKRFIELMSRRENDYYEWVIKHPITSWGAPTYILRPETDLIVSEEVGHDFINQHHCQVTIMADGEHWFHTPMQLEVLRKWEEDVVINHKNSRVMEKIL